MRNARYAIVALLAGAATMIAASCASSPSVNTREIPSWYLNTPRSKTMIYGTGSAKEQSLDLSKQLAVATARQAISNEVKVSVKNGITRYLQQGGSGQSQQALNFGDSVTRQVSDNVLKGCIVEKVVVTRDGRVYVLVSYPVEKMNQDAKQAFTRNNAAAFAQFQSDQALKALDNELAHTPPSSPKQ